MMAARSERGVRRRQRGERDGESNKSKFSAGGNSSDGFAGP
jgi:hypothetical protein